MSYSPLPHPPLGIAIGYRHSAHAYILILGAHRSIMADEPLQTDVYLTKEQIEWVKLAIHRDMIYQDETEPVDWKYNVMEKLDYDLMAINK